MMNTFSLVANPTNDTLVYVFEISDEISHPVWHNMQKALKNADSLDADYFIINMNTYGGLVLIADSIRTAILRSPIPTYVLINNNAASAGALISIACDKIYMLPGSTIGAATVVTETGEAAIDKYQSYMRSKMRATAEETGRDPLIAEAMVDQDIEIEGITEKGKLLTFTVSEAIANGFCDKEVSGLAEILAENHLSSAKVVHFVPTTLDKIIGLLIHPAVSGILIMVMLGGIYFELQTPGIGFPIAASAIAATLFFAPLYLEGMAANWEIVVFVIGVLALAAEIFVIPGTGITGVIGVVFIISGLTLSMVKNIDFDFSLVSWDGILHSFSIVLLSILLLIVFLIVLIPKMLSNNRLKSVVLTSSQNVNEGYIGVDQSIKNLIGHQGVALSDLRPVGKILLQEKHYDATSIDNFISKNDKIEVIGSEGPQLIVRKM
jgi:membrane-bound serine protease (ClpP class)